jgi:hypothetical protein
VHYNDDEWSDDEQEMMHEQSQRKLGLSGNPNGGSHAGAADAGPAPFARVLSEPENQGYLVGDKEDENAVVIKEGWLNKKGGARRNWKKRWFVLQVIGEGANALKVLSYYESSGANDPKGSILIDQGTMARNVTDTAMSAKHAFSFEITHRGEQYHTYHTPYTI